AAADVAWLEFADQLHKADLAFVFVAVIAAHEQDSRPAAVLDLRNRYADPAIGRDVAGVRQADVTDLLTVFVEIDLGREAGGCGHGDNSRGGFGGVDRCKM